MIASSHPREQGSTAGAQDAQDLFPLVYEDLRKLAAYRLAQAPPGGSLQPTDLVHEAWLRMAKSELQKWENRVHFFATAAVVMRQVLVDHLRSRSRLKRGGGQLWLDLDSLEIAGTAPEERVLVVAEALQELEREEPDKARVVVLKFFCGLKDHEAAAQMGVTERTIERHWAYARAWLIRRIREGTN